MPSTAVIVIAVVSVLIALIAWALVMGNAAGAFRNDPEIAVRGRAARLNLMRKTGVKFRRKVDWLDTGVVRLYPVGQLPEGYDGLASSVVGYKCVSDHGEKPSLVIDYNRLYIEELFG